MTSRKSNAHVNDVVKFRSDDAPRHQDEGTGWKGFENAEALPPKDDLSITTEDMDMTPMVDVTFLLLIFFMVTASFTLQKSVPLPVSQTANPGRPTEKTDIEVTVEIDQHNTYYVSSSREDSIECPSEREMRQQVRNVAASSTPDRLVMLGTEVSSPAFPRLLSRPRLKSGSLVGWFELVATDACFKMKSTIGAGQASHHQLKQS